MADLDPGAVFAGHVIEGVAGRGGVGVVYRARHIALDHLVALKVISPGLADDPDWRARFVAESRAAVSIRHPNVVGVHHAGEEDGVMFVTMDLIEGTDLRRVLRERGPLDPQHAVEILARVASALDAAHELGLVHRDVKPSNILIEVRSGGGERGPWGGERVFLTDFGLTKRIDSSADVTATGAFVGTIDYVSPEQIQGGRIDARTDVYALGCVLYEMITGLAPFARLDEKVAKLYAHLKESPQPLSELAPGAPPALDPVIARALAKEPHDRYRSAGDLARAAQAAVEGHDSTVEMGSVATGEAAPDSDEEQFPPTEAHPPPTGADQPPTEAAAPPAPTGAGDTPTEALPRERRLARRRAWLVGLVVAAIVAVVLVLALGGGGGADQTGAPTASSPAFIPVSGFPVGIGVAEDGGVWVGQRQGNSVSLIDPSGQNDPQVFGFGHSSAPEGVTIGPASVWVALQGIDKVGRIDLDTQNVRKSPEVGSEPRASAHEPEYLWVTDGGSAQVTRLTLDRQHNGEVVDTQAFPVGNSPHGIALGAGHVWVVNRDDSNVTELDDPGGGLVQNIDVGNNPKSIAYDEKTNTLWVANTGVDALDTSTGEADDGTVTPIDAQTGKAGTEIDVGGDPRGVAVGLGSVWVANGFGYVTQIDPKTGKVIDKITVGESPEMVATSDAEVWVTDGTGERVYHFAP
jgi:DNA-binding beta-propeller fold protein YncE